MSLLYCGVHQHHKSRGSRCKEYRAVYSPQLEDIKDRIEMNTTVYDMVEIKAPNVIENIEFRVLKYFRCQQNIVKISSKILVRPKVR